MHSHEIAYTARSNEVELAEHRLPSSFVLHLNTNIFWKNKYLYGDLISRGYRMRREANSASKKENNE